MKPRLVQGAGAGLAGVSAGRHDELRALAERVKKGDSVALRTFLAAIVPPGIRVVRRVLGPEHPDVEDVAYEAAYATIAGLERFRGDGTVLHFACRVAVLTAMNVRRRDAAVKRPQARDVADPDAVVSDVPGPDHVAATSAIADLVRELLATLPEPLAEALALHGVLGYTAVEIADACGVPLETVRSRLRLARRALRRRALSHPKLREVLEEES